jgi:hypothetical protein
MGSGFEAIFRRGKEQGYLTFAQLNEMIARAKCSPY